MAVMTDEQLRGRKPVQIAYGVTDLEKAALHWATTVGAGPFFVHERMPVQDVRGPNGEPGDMHQGCAMGQWGPVMVELVKMDLLEPPAVQAVMGRLGLNHIAYIANDTDAEVERLVNAGAPVVLSVGFGDIRVHFHDAVATQGFAIEHYPYAEVIQTIYTKVAEAAEGWDGSNPVRGEITF
jgi:hypothetical protein